MDSDRIMSTTCDGEYAVLILWIIFYIVYISSFSNLRKAVLLSPDHYTATNQILSIWVISKVAKSSYIPFHLLFHTQFRIGYSNLQRTIHLRRWLCSQWLCFPSEWSLAVLLLLAVSIAGICFKSWCSDDMYLVHGTSDSFPFQLFMPIWKGDRLHLWFEQLDSTGIRGRADQIAEDVGEKRDRLRRALRMVIDDRFDCWMLMKIMDIQTHSIFFWA